MNALDIHLAQALKGRRPKAQTVSSPAPTILKVNRKLFGPARDIRGRFIKNTK